MKYPVLAEKTSEALEKTYEVWAAINENKMERFKNLLNEMKQKKLRPECNLLRLAMNYDRVEIMEVLLDQGANPNLPDATGDLPLNEAVRKNNVEMVSVLLRYGADPKLPNKRGFSAQVQAKRENRLGVLEVIEKHLSQNAAEPTLAVSRNERKKTQGWLANANTGMVRGEK